MAIDDRADGDHPYDGDEQQPRDESPSGDDKNPASRGEPPSRDDSPPPPENDNAPENEPEVDKGYGLIPSDGTMMPYKPHGPGIFRDNVIGILGSLFSNTSAYMNMVLQNLPNTIVNKKVAKNGVTVRNLPQVFDGIDSYFKQVMFALQHNKELIPDEVELQNIKHCFLTLRMIQTELTNIAEAYGQSGTGHSERLTPRPYIEKDMQQGKRVTALDVGAVLGGRAGRSRQLGASERETLQVLGRDIGMYTMIAAHLLGAQVIGFSVSEKENLDKAVEREEVAKLMSITPAQPWADAMKKLKIQLPMIEALSFRIMTR
jgi:hypothetical protein